MASFLYSHIKVTARSKCHRAMLNRLMSMVSLPQPLNLLSSQIPEEYSYTDPVPTQNPAKVITLTRSQLLISIISVLLADYEQQKGRSILGKDRKSVV